jgi:activator of HSP90 ATPase
MEKPQAVGSIWNVNSWHWEMKNYSQPAKQILEKLLLSLTFDVSPELKITHRKVKFEKS